MNDIASRDFDHSMREQSIFTTFIIVKYLQIDSLIYCNISL